MIEQVRYLFCHCCSNGTLEGGCMYDRQATCGHTEEEVREIGAKIGRIMELHNRQRTGGIKNKETP